MEIPNLQFVFTSPSQKPRSRRTIELERSSARSHAAKVSFQRTLLQKQGSKSGHQIHSECKASVSGGEPKREAEKTSRCRQQVPKRISVRTRPQSRQADEEPQHKPIVLSIPISTSMLDPFLHPAADLTVPDKHLLHHCMLSQPV